MAFRLSDGKEKFMTQTGHRNDNRLADLFQRLAPRLMAAGRRILGSNEAASDAMQDTFVRLWSRQRDAGEGLVMTAMRNTCIDSLRSRHDTEFVDDSDIGSFQADGETETELYDEVNRLIGLHLSERDRMILIMRDRDEFEIDAIAARTGLSEGNIRLILSRARRTVREAYRNNISHGK